MPQRIDVPGMGVVEFPDGMSDAQIAAAIKANMPAPEPGMLESLGAGLGKGFGSTVLGAQSLVGKGIGAVGGMLPDGNPLSQAGNWLVNDAQTGRANLAQQLSPYKSANPITAGAGELGGEIAATLPVGGVLGKGVGMLGPKAAPLADALATSGFRAGGLTGVPGMALRMVGGAATGGASAAMVNPESAKEGAIIGGLMPPAIKGVGMVGQALGAGVRKSLGSVSPEVAALADRAEQLGIKVPADRLVQSKPLDAVASGLNYVPFSGRAATESKMNEQLNRALSRTFGQNDSNVTFALRKADDALGSKFDNFLKSNAVNLDEQLLQDLASASNQAAKELGSDGASIIAKQVDEIVAKGGNGVIDGQAAYNIKRTLDRIGKRNSPEAWYALDLKQKLMGALDRSVGPEKSKSFAELRQQYGNMLALQKLAKNGVEGEISAARIANLPNINNQPLQEIADIAAQFVKPREAQHGAMQRAIVGGAGMTAGAASFGLPGVVGAAGASMVGRGTNAALESDLLRKLLMNRAPNPGLLNQQLYYQAAPVIAAQ